MKKYIVKHTMEMHGKLFVHYYGRSGELLGYDTPRKHKELTAERVRRLGYVTYDGATCSWHYEHHNDNTKASIVEFCV